MERTENTSLAPAVTQALRIIEFIASSDHMVGISDVCRGLDVNSNMAFRVLKTLEQEDWLYSDDSGKYQLTLKSMNITSSALARNNINGVASPYVHSLWKETGESTYLAILNGDKVFYLQHLDSIYDIKVTGKVGGFYPAESSAPGRALLAHCSEEYLEEHIFKTGKVKDKKKYMALLADIRDNRRATDNEEYGKGMFCYAAPIFDYTNTAVAAIGCSGASALYGSIEKFVERHGENISAAARKISAIMGYIEKK